MKAKAYSHGPMFEFCYMIDIRQDKGHIFVEDNVVLSLHIDSWKLEIIPVPFHTWTKISTETENKSLEI